MPETTVGDKFITLKEVSCHDGTPYPDEYLNNGAWDKLKHAFLELRRLCGNHPIVITSGYRTVAHNKRVGGAKNSSHLYGEALDLRPPSHLSAMEFYLIAKTFANQIGITGLGLYTDHIHIDVRISNVLVTWSEV